MPNLHTSQGFYAFIKEHVLANGERHSVFVLS